MRAEMLQRLRETMRGGEAQNGAGTVGTLERRPVPAGSSNPFQHKVPTKKPGVPTVPTVPTHKVGEANKTSKTASEASELALERARNDPRVHRCGCGGVGIHGVGWFLRQPDRATWYCSPCFRALRSAGRA